MGQYEYFKQISSDEKKNDYLVHHGILGQKWGRRRYQNADGSLTELGRRRIYGEGKSFNTQERKRYQRAEEGYRYQRDVNRLERRSEKALEKGKMEKYAKLQDAKKKVEKNRDIMYKDLSPEEIKRGEVFFNTHETVWLGTMVTGGGIIPALAIGATAYGVQMIDKGNRDAMKVARQQDKDRKKAYVDKKRKEAGV